MGVYNEEEKEEHESFGLIRFSRINSNGEDFFGSEIRHDNYINLEIDCAKKYTDLSSVTYFPMKKIFRGRMTQAQFAELITSMNYGSGVPITLEMYNNKKIDSLPTSETRKDNIHRKFKERMLEFNKNLKKSKLDADILIKKKTLSKEDQYQLSQIIDHVVTEVTSNIPFFLERFQDAMDDVVNDAKNNIEASIVNKITQTGLKVLFEEQQKLIENNNE